MYTYRPKGNKIYHYSICSFKGIEFEGIRKQRLAPVQGDQYAQILKAIVLHSRI